MQNWTHVSLCACTDREGGDMRRQRFRARDGEEEEEEAEKKIPCILTTIAATHNHTQRHDERAMRGERFEERFDGV